MPAEPVEAARDALAVGPERQRRHRPRRARRICRIAGDAGASHPGIVQIVVRLEVGIGDRPVVGHAVEAPDLEVRRVKARRVCGPVDGAAADRVEHQRRDVGLAVVHRIVLGQAADIRVEAEARGSAEFPVCEAGRVLLRLLPSALLEAQNAEPGIREPPGHRRAGGTGADDQNVDECVGQIFILPSGRMTKRLSKFARIWKASQWQPRPKSPATLSYPVRTRAPCRT